MRYKSNIFIYMLAFLSFFSCYDNPFIEHFFSFNFLKLAVKIFVTLVCLVLLMVKKKKLGFCYKMTFLMYFVMVLGTLINRSEIVFSDFYSMILCISSIATISSVIELYKKDNEIFKIFNIWKSIMVILIVFDVFTRIVFPQGLYKTDVYSINWLLGYKGERAILTFPLIVIVFYLREKKNRYLVFSDCVIYCLVILDGFLSGAVSMSILLLLLIVMVIVVEKLYKNKHKILIKLSDVLINFKVVFSIYFLLIIQLLLEDTIGITSFLTKLFDKGEGLSSRTDIWSCLMKRLSSNMVLGVGFRSGNWYMKTVGFDSASNAHNALLTILIDGGVFLAILYFALHILIIYRKRGMLSVLLALSIYVNLALGMLSSVLVFAPFCMMPLQLLDNEDNGIRKFKCSA